MQVLRALATSAAVAGFEEAGFEVTVTDVPLSVSVMLKEKLFLQEGLTMNSPRPE